jgi:hypothetical protein
MVTDMHLQQPAKKLLADGFTTIAQFFPIELLEQIEACIVDLYLMQARKIGEYSAIVPYWLIRQVFYALRIDGARGQRSPLSGSEILSFVTNNEESF